MGGRLVGWPCRGLGCGGTAADGPGAGDEVDRSAGVGWEGGAEVVAERGAAVLGEGHGVGGGGALAAEEGGPVVVEVAEDGGHVDGAQGDVLEAGAGEEALERLGLAEWEAAALIERRGGGIECGGGVPEVAHEL